MDNVKEEDAHRDFTKILGEASFGGRVLIERQGSPVVAVISIEDLRLFERLEDEMDATAAEEASKQERVSLDRIKASFEYKHVFS